MTTEQKYQRRLARKYGVGAIVYSQHSPDHEYYGKFSPFWYAKQAAWHAFNAHPELRESSLEVVTEPTRMSGYTVHHAVAEMVEETGCSWSESLAWHNID